MGEVGGVVDWTCCSPVTVERVDEAMLDFTFGLLAIDDFGCCELELLPVAGLEPVLLFGIVPVNSLTLFVFIRCGSLTFFVLFRLNNLSNSPISGRLWRRSEEGLVSVMGVERCEHEGQTGDVWLKEDGRCGAMK